MLLSSERDLKRWTKDRLGQVAEPILRYVGSDVRIGEENMFYLGSFDTAIRSS